MNIYWLGDNCVKIEGKDTTVVVDPVEAKNGKMPKTNAEVVLLARPYETELSFAKSEAFVVDTAGEFESHDVFINARLADDKGELAYRFTIDDVTFGHIGNVTSVSSDVSNFLEGVDVLLVPAGGDGSLTPEQAATATNVIEPRIVIPVHLKTSASPKRATAKDFAAALGASADSVEVKLVLKKKDLPQEETRLVILES